MESCVVIEKVSYSLISNIDYLLNTKHEKIVGNNQNYFLVSIWNIQATHYNVDSAYVEASMSNWLVYKLTS